MESEVMLNYLEMLARLGAGSAHPGGFTATMEQLRQLPIPRGHHILEVGCGTGRTACTLSMQGYRVTALDIREDMLKKARQRAAEMKAKVDFVQGDAAQLPFESQHFDTILVESVSVFADTDKAFQEYFRVLKPRGAVYDREAMMAEEASPEVNRSFSQFYGIDSLLNGKEWIERMEQAGFESCEVWNPVPFPLNMLQDQIDYPDHYQTADLDAYDDEELRETVMRYDKMMNLYGGDIRSGVIIGVKSEA